MAVKTKKPKTYKRTGKPTGIAFPPEIAKRIQQEAIKSERTFGAEVRFLVRIALNMEKA